MNYIPSLFSDMWAMSEDRHAGLMSLILPSIQAGRFDEVEEYLKKAQTESYASDVNFAVRWDLDDTQLPYDSIAVLFLSGELYSWITERVSSDIDLAMANERIIGIILVINGPGGMITGLDTLTDKISTSEKPVVSYISGMAESAHYWIASATQKRFLASRMCEVGSVGIVGVYRNYKKYFEMQGIDYRTIYPEGADLKNYASRQIEENNDEGPYREKLQKLHEFFCQTVSKNLKIPYDKESPVFRGDTFMGDDAIAVGLADGYSTLDGAARWLLAQKVKNQANSLF